ncbi:MAG: D-alanine--D-alanine ligase [Clostridiales bacterium]|jgi:D-alanine-D-alanine ligase|nr:D-alanine--D-alanine ligase [Clostridiales bacterium]
MSKKVVAVLFGGCSNEHEISMLSAANVISSMSADKYFVMPVYITKDGRWLLYDGSIENIKNVQWEKFGTSVVLSPDSSHKGLLRIVGDKVKCLPVDIVFPVLHGKNGEDGTIQGLCEIAGIPYVGCGVLSSSVSMDKEFTNKIAQLAGINQADFLSFRAYELENIDDVCKKIRYKLGYPCFVKPANAGSSVGVSKANNKKELETALKNAAAVDRKIVVEKAIVGREIECAVLGNEAVTASAVGEILAAGDFYDFDAKYNNGDSKTVVPADIPAEISNEIRALAVEIFKAVDGAGFARVDFFLEEGTNKVFFNEINTIPGFTAISLYPILWEESGISQPELIDRLIELGFENNQYV